MAIYTFNNWGYEGSLVKVEVDLRKGIPAVDIVGLSDACVKETRERIKSAFSNSESNLPAERVLISLSPADVRKEGRGFDLPIALAIILQQIRTNPNALHCAKVDAEKDVLVMGELELSGNVRETKAVTAALQTAVEHGIKFAIVPDVDYLKIPEGIRVCKVKNLNDAHSALAMCGDSSYFHYIHNGTIYEKKEEQSDEIQFTDVKENSLDSIKGMNGLKYAMAVAVAGRHSLLAYGQPGCGKTLTLQHLPELMPKLTSTEKQSVDRIYSLAGLSCSDVSKDDIRPFRIPHQTASIEGICGGGIQCRPGEITLAHNGVLFLDEAAEFRTSVLQMLRVPIETHSITLSRAGRTTVYPARFQLVMATSSCPCGNFGSKDRVCLCSAKSVELYWKKFSSPLLDRVAIRYNCNAEDNEQEFTLEELRSMIKTAWERQYARQGKLNEDLTVQEVNDYIKLTSDATHILETKAKDNGWSPRKIANVMKLARTLADIHDNKEYETVAPVYVKIAIGLCASTPLETL